MRMQTGTPMCRARVLSLAVVAMVGMASMAEAGQSTLAQEQPAATAEAPPRPASFEGMDRNADGKVSEEEYRNTMAFVFAGEDTNKDGVVTREEAQAAGRRALRKFEAVDLAKSGQIELSAFLEFSLSVFHAADTDGDGVMTRAERNAMRAKVRAVRDAAGESTPKP